MTTNTVPPERPTSLGGVQSTVVSDRSFIATWMFSCLQGS